MYSKLSKIVLVISSALFAIAVGYYIYSEASGDQITKDSNSNSLTPSQFEEYAYYDITDSTATLVLGDNPKGEHTLFCEEAGSSNGKGKVEVSITGKETVIPNLLSATSYSCSINAGERSQSISGFETKNKDYLLLSNLSADAYALADGGVFRATWDSLAPAYLITRIATGEPGKAVEHREEVIFDLEYTDDSLKVGYSYEYQIRALEYPDILGTPIGVKFSLAADSKFEDIKINANEPSPLPFRGLSSQELLTEVLKYSEIIVKKGEQAFAATQWGLLAVSRDSLKNYQLITVLDKNYQIVRTYSLSAPSMATFKLSENKLTALDDVSSNSSSHVIIVTPSGKRSKQPVVSGEVELSKAYPYVFIEYHNGELIRIEQTKAPETNISFENSTSLITWSPEPFASSYLLVIKPESTDIAYKVAVSNPSYKLDKLSNSEKTKVVIYAYTPQGIKLLGDKAITRVSNEIASVRSVVLNKAGSALIVTVESENKYSHLIEISPAGKEGWKALTEIKAGETSFFFENVIALESGSYKLRIISKYKELLGESNNPNCELQVDKNINYQLICK